MRWLERLRPDAYVAEVADIDLDKLREQGYRLLLTDLDNTLVPWNHPEVSEDLADWLQQAKNKGFQVCIVSNNHGPRVEKFAAKADVAFIAGAKKPKPAAFLQAMERFRATPETTVMVGDQLFTDIRGGNRCGLHTILVLPIHPKEWWGTRLVRRVERIAMYMLVRRGLVVPERKVKQENE
ncbi:YqeG family HAD IIIA-type phosphatase [Alicyclobacillus pomorum]|uniref:YqeG family HAD IIIA-type phosphatase n=1 Tax=Alicyclobacillus pomorum TaxID=204470 RepID=UPI000414B0D8|nr:YqeG family HAD IIIA-type phosphatase [Alicyclobacillus pomorum]